MALNIAIAGLGVVGSSVYEMLSKQKDLIEKRSNAQIKVVAAFSRTKKDFLDDSIKFYSSHLDLAADNNVDLVVEAIGGDTTAKELAESCLKNKKHFVTSNKMLIAKHGFELANLAEENGVSLRFEASVAAAIPVIKTLKESLVSSNIYNISGILNGTSNYILTSMFVNGSDFNAALKNAQKLGYAESDPSFDINGTDAAHKITILSSIAFGVKPSFDQTYFEGIEKITLHDKEIAEKLGYTIKLLGMSQLNLEDNSISCSVYPVLVKETDMIASVNGVLNAISVESSHSGYTFLVGQGAGGYATASSVISDVTDIARGGFDFAFGASSKNLVEAKYTPVSKRIGSYLVKFESGSKISDFSTIFDKNFKEECFIELESGFISAAIIEKISEDKIDSLLHEVSQKTNSKSLGFLRIE